MTKLFKAHKIMLLARVEGEESTGANPHSADEPEIKKDLHESISCISGIQRDLYDYHQVPDKGPRGQRIGPMPPTEKKTNIW